MAVSIRKERTDPGPIELLTQSAVVIPARLGSTRFPRKVLARQTGKYLIQHVWEGVSGTPGLSRVIIATDSEEVLEVARSFGAEGILTSPSHRTGTDRVAEVARTLPPEIQFVVNVQGDEPFIQAEDIALVIDLFRQGGKGVGMTTLAVERSDLDGFQNPNNVKVTRDRRGRALYFSRATIPFLRSSSGAGSSGGAAFERPGSSWRWLHHVGIYGFRRDFLPLFASLEPGKLERIERLEQLRAMENGYPIQVGITPRSLHGIDTNDEYQRFVRQYRDDAGGQDSVDQDSK